MEVNLAGSVNVGGKTGGSVKAKADQKLTVSGTVAAKGTEQGGKVELAGADVDLAGKVNVSGTPGGSVTVQADQSLSVGGTITATGFSGTAGIIGLTGTNIGISGGITANGATGGIVNATSALSLTITGAISATGLVATGGAINVTSAEVKLVGAKLDASGATGGGKIQIGGGYQGTGSLAHALKVVIDPTTSIRADALGKGDGGTVIVWSDKFTSFAGQISARGGAQGGNGGFVEVSGKEKLAYTGFTDLRSAKGKTGTLLLDPNDYVIAAAGGDITGADLSTALDTANVTILSSSGGGGVNGDILVNDAVSWTSGNLLTMTAFRDIAVNANISGGALTLNAGGNITVAPGQTINRTATGTGNFLFNAGGDIIVNAGASIAQTINLGANDKLNIVFNADSDANGTGRINLDGTSGNLVALTTNGGNITLGGQDTTLSGAVTGVATGNATNAEGVRLSFASLDAGDGSIAIFGQGGTSAGGTNHGVFVTDSTVSANGGITITGTGGSGGNFNTGVDITSNSLVTTAGAGAIVITGTGGTTAGTSNAGINVDLGASITSGLGGGTITLNGTGGAGTSQEYGVFITDSGTSISGQWRCFHRRRGRRYGWLCQPWRRDFGRVGLHLLGKSFGHRDDGRRHVQQSRCVSERRRDQLQPGHHHCCGNGFERRERRWQSRHPDSARHDDFRG